MSRHELFLKAANVAALLLVFVVGFFNPMHREDGHEGNEEENLINKNHTGFPYSHLSPADYTFSIWSVIYALLVGFVIYQWFEAANDATVDGVQYYHVIINILCSAWLIIWKWEFYLADVFISLLMLITLFKIFNNLQFYPPKNLADRLFIHYPFTIYAGWALVSIFLGLWIAVRALDTIPFSTAAVVIIGFEGLYFIDYHQRHDVILTATIIWGLIGIAVRNYENLPILVATTASSGLILGGILRVLERKIIAWHHLRNQRLDERSPLLAP